MLEIASMCKMTIGTPLLIKFVVVVDFYNN